MPTLHFSPQPGPCERHLRRRADNPLFRRASVTAAELDAARAADAVAAQRFMDDFHTLVREAAVLSPNEESENILALKGRLDQAYARCAALGGDPGRLQEALRRLTGVVMRAVAVAAAGDPLAQRELEQEAAAREQNYRLLRFPLVADLMLTDSPIPQDELVPSLLSEPLEALEAALWLFDAAHALKLLHEARELCGRLAASGALPAGLEAKVALVERAAAELPAASPD